MTAVKIGLGSMMSTARANLSVGPPRGEDNGQAGEIAPGAASAAAAASARSRRST